MPELPGNGSGRGIKDQHWTTFVRNHAEGIVACDFFTVVTAAFRVLYVFVVVEHATRRILHFNVTAHPTADWTLQQLREAIPEDHSYKFLIRDRDAKFSRRLDESIRRLRLQILKTPIRTPQANGLCERTIGTIRRECLDYLIPLGERHLYRILSEWVRHYNAARPHTALGPGIPVPGPELPTKLQSKRHEIPTGARVTARPILSGLHHEYSLQLVA
jgi:transposase InsO family protein